MHERDELRPSSPFDEADYWQQSRRPLVSLVFVLPLLALYEFGVLMLGSQAIRNGADVWLRQLLDLVGFGHYFLLPILTIAILLAWHHTTGEPWRLPGRVLHGMFLECAALGIVLLGVAHVQGRLFTWDMVGDPFLFSPWWASQQGPALLSTGGGVGHAIARLVSYFGAGIYEEVLFRLMLLPLVAVAFRAAGVESGRSWILAAVVTSVVFSLAHYVGPHGDEWQLYSFTFRVLAGLFFSGLFIYRGFGIAVGTHALYDIFVGLF